MTDPEMIALAAALVAAVYKGWFGRRVSDWMFGSDAEQQQSLLQQHLADARTRLDSDAADARRAMNEVANQSWRNRFI